jgi:acetyl-CoA acyltransferase
MPVHIAAAIRTPFTRVDGALAGWHPVDLTAELMKSAIISGAVDEVYLGCAEPVGAQGANMARAAVLAAGWSDNVSGVVIDRAETSGMAALHAAAAAIEAGTIATALVVGVCSASVVPPGASALARTYGRPWGDGPARRVEADGGLLPAPVAAERAAHAAGIGRTAQDEWAVGSHERRGIVVSNAVVAIGAQPGEGVAIQRGTVVDGDDRRDRPDDPSGLTPSFDPDGSVTGFTFAPPADGVSALVLSSEPVGPEIVGVGRSAGHPLDPVGGVESAVAAARSDVNLADVNRWEITEPTAAAALLVIDRLGVSATSVNRGGGTLGVGDAGAAEELRLLVDGIALAGPREQLMALSYGPTGAAATLVRCP